MAFRRPCTSCQHASRQNTGDEHHNDTVKVTTRDGRRVPAKCLLWYVKDKCCSLSRPVPRSLPLLSTFYTLLGSLAPQVHSSEFDNRTFRDGDVVPKVGCPNAVGALSSEAEWVNVQAPGNPLVSAWVEKDSSDETNPTNRMRCRMPPGLTSCKTNATLVCQRTGLTRTVSFVLETPFEYRTFDGSNNNVAHPSWGQSNTLLKRISFADYGDGKSSIRAGANPRDVSNKVVRYTGADAESPRSHLSDMVWAWGQFLDHEIDLTPEDSGEVAPVVAPNDDPTLPDGVISFHRSRFVTDADGVRQHPNVISAYIDASNVYGDSQERALALRQQDGTGKLKTSHNNTCPPYNVGAIYDNANANPNVSLQEQYLCGDVRVNENALLTSMHTLFILEHNRLCDVFASQFPDFAGDDERLYQEARRFVAALMQKITFADFLPTLLGDNALGPYTGYDENVDASIAIEFSTAAYRFGHSMVSEHLWLDREGSKRVALADVFFKPAFVAANGISGLLEGAAWHRMQRIDAHIVEALRDMLFARPGDPAGHLHDLATLNMQRGRDHGVPPYNVVREAYGLTKRNSFAEVSSDVDVQATLAAAYATVDDIDAWVGGLAEDHVSGGHVGELISTALKEQFERLRVGDRFWYERDLPPEFLDEVQQTTLADVIRRNTSAIVRDNVFVA